MNELNIIPNCKAAIDIIESGEASQDQVLRAQEFVRVLGEVYRELKENLETATIAYIEKNGEIRDGEKRYYVGPNKSTKCLDIRKTAEAVFEVSGGDWDAFVECLSSGAFKPGHTKKLLGDKAEALFEDTETKDLKTGEVGKKRLQAVDYSKIPARSKQ